MLFHDPPPPPMRTSYLDAPFVRAVAVVPLLQSIRSGGKDTEACNWQAEREELLFQSQGPAASTKTPARPSLSHSLSRAAAEEEEWLSPEFGKLLTG